MPLITHSAHLIAPFIALFEAIMENATPGMEAFLAACSFEAFLLLRSSCATLAGRHRAFSQPVRMDFPATLLPFLNLSQFSRRSNRAVLPARIPDVPHPWCPDATFLHILSAAVPTAFTVYLHGVFLTDVERLRCVGWMREHSIKMN